MDLIRFSIPSEPQPRQSVRSMIIEPKNGKKPFIHHYQPNDRAASWIGTVRHFANLHKPPQLFDDAIGLVIIYRKFRPKSVKKEKTFLSVKPDLGNLEKPLLDAMQGIIYTNDSRVVFKAELKMYSDKCGVDIIVIPPDKLSDMINRILCQVLE